MLTTKPRWFRCAIAARDRAGRRPRRAKSHRSERRIVARDRSPAHGRSTAGAARRRDKALYRNRGPDRSRYSALRSTAPRHRTSTAPRNPLTVCRSRAGPSGKPQHIETRRCERRLHGRSVRHCGGVVDKMAVDSQAGLDRSGKSTAPPAPSACSPMSATVIEITPDRRSAHWHSTPGPARYLSPTAKPD